MILNILIFALSILLIAHGLFSLMMLLYTWTHPEHFDTAGSPTMYAAPQVSFTVIVPARHEAKVIAQTVQQIWQTNYPKLLLELVVVCEATDKPTITAARQTITALDHPHVQLITFSNEPINKPRGLNVGLAQTQHEVVAIFDAEDDVHPDIFQVINTVLLHDQVSIVQGGVQLMDFRSSWYASHNVVEYYFWFKSQLHYNTKIGAVPLAGNTVFIKRPLLEKIGGWDEQCLTEDADIGVRLSVLGEKITTIYDPAHATREETPHSLLAFIKQRTRWSQGFLQILSKGDWRKLPTFKQRWLMGYTLAAPFLQALLLLMIGPIIFTMFMFDAPVWLAMLSLLPAYILGLQFVVRLVGLFEFAADYNLKIALVDIVRFSLGFLPYQLLLATGVIRAIYRHLTATNNWEKTEHRGTHRHQRQITSPDLR